MNKAAIKQYALECSKVVKNGRFTRVGSDFIEELEAEVESVIRKLEHSTPVCWPSEVPLDGHVFHESVFRARLCDAVNRMIARMIQRKVERQPSCGVTLGRVS